ncbi:AAA family ATPase [Methanospirillum sp.]
MYHLGRIRSIDRTEIESYQSIRNTFIEFFSSSAEKPLSITVFGPPGSGKSFGIEEIINTIEKEKASILKFNLSQFSGYHDLIKAFHKIRDSALKGKIPIVFFDEFDSDIEKQKLGWLKYFLSPMQDGEFFDGEMTHPIGKTIFVFAGGIYPTLKEFCNGKDDGNNDIAIYNHDFANAKGLDFLSRLRGYINIIGCDQTIPSDEIYKVRRALLLRSILKEKAPNFFKSDVLDINDDVKRAFIKVSSFKHGVRSMKAIVDMSKIGTKKRYEVALLPSYHQLELHTDAYDFNVLILRDIQFIVKLDKIIDRVQEIFNEINKTLNYKNVNIPLFSISDKEIEKMKQFLKIFINNSNIEKISKQIALSIPDFLKSINCSYKTRNKNNINLSKEGLITEDKILVKIGEKNVIKKIERYNRIFDYFGRKTPENPLKLFEEMISKDSYLGLNWHYFEYVDEDYKPLIKSLSECINSNKYEKNKIIKERLLNIIIFIEFFYPKFPTILDDDFVIYPL